MNPGRIKLPAGVMALVPYLKPSLASLIDWTPLVPKFLGLSLRFFSDREYEKVKEQLTPRLPKFVEWGRESAEAWRVEELSTGERVRLGNILLEIYFCQLASETPIFIDLRLDHFSRPLENHSIVRWTPSRMWWIFDASFRKNLSALYSAYYSNDLSAFRQSLTGVGLISEGLPEKAADEIVRAFWAHFGSGDQTSVEFKVVNFNESFESILKLLKIHGIKVPGEFSILGLCLVGLYVSLESLNVPLNVRAAYLHSKGKVE